MGDNEWIKYAATMLGTVAASLGFPALWKAYFSNKSKDAIIAERNRIFDRNVIEEERDELKRFIEAQRVEIKAQREIIQTLMLQQGLLITSVDMMLAVIEGELKTPNTIAAIVKVKEYLHTLMKDHE